MILWCLLASYVALATRWICTQWMIFLMASWIFPQLAERRVLRRTFVWTRYDKFCSSQHNLCDMLWSDKNKEQKTLLAVVRCANPRRSDKSDCNIQKIYDSRKLSNSLTFSLVSETPCCNVMKQYSFQKYTVILDLFYGILFFI